MTGPEASDDPNRNSMNKPNVDQPSPHDPSASDDQDTSQAPGQQTKSGSSEASPTSSGEPVTEGELIASLEKERLRLEAEVAELKDRFLRAHAEMDNLRKRTEREKADAARYGISKFAMDVVTVADNLQRAMDAVGDPAALADDVKAMHEGVALTAQELTKALDKNGVARIPAKGELFDPHLHQAMMEQPDPSVASGTILQVFQEGYVIGDRVLRPSMVVVARGGPKPAKSETEPHVTAPPHPSDHHEIELPESDPTGKPDDPTS